MHDKEARNSSAKKKRNKHTHAIPKGPNTVEAEASDAVETLITRPRWSEGEVHLALWKLLETGRYPARYLHTTQVINN
ncbi:hypothetical protein F4809DRAFT_640737 [Biscogniauxia mediterranea]|nr:hypothetical protein F4809DRAFT_640737 [Biscogniauxia mediterranea]